MAILAVAVLAGDAFGSHLRGTSISWAPTGVPGQVKFTIKYAERGGTRAIGSGVAIPFNFGDGSSGTASGTVTSVNAAEDWFFSELTVTHTYAGTGPYAAFYGNCCRVGTLKAGHDQTIQMVTTVRPQSGNASPVASMPPVITVPIRALTGFVVSANDLDRDRLAYRLATPAEMFAAPGAPNEQLSQPPGMTINAATGQVAWNTTVIPASLGGTPEDGDLWAAQFMVEDLDASGQVRSKVPIDVILKFVTASGQPPAVTFNPAGPISVQAGTPITVTVTGTDADAGARVTLNATGLPVGATASNLNNSLTPPVVSTFTWTPPTGQQSASYAISYTATDDTFQQALGSLSIFVETNVAPTITGPATLNSLFTLPAPILVNVADANGDALTVEWQVDGVVVRTDSVAASQNPTALTFPGPYGAAGAHTVRATVTDTKSASVVLVTGVTVVQAPQLIAFGSLPPRALGAAPFPVTATATSNLEVSFSVVSGPATIAGNLVTVTGVGAVTIRAGQGGDANYLAAAPVDQSFDVVDLDVTSITFETRFFAAPHVRPASTADALAKWNALPVGVAGYGPGPRTLTIFDNVSNAATFGGRTDNLGYHHHFAFTAPEPGTLAIRMGADFGFGGTLVIDGQEIEFRNNDMWWNGSYNDATQYLKGTVTIAAGPHVIDSYGFEECCDGVQQAQYSYLGAPYKTFTSPPNFVPVVALTGAAVVAPGSTSQYDFTVTDTDTTPPVSFTVVSLSCGVNGTQSGPATIAAAGGSFRCAFTGAPALVSAQVMDNRGAISNLATLSVTFSQSIAFDPLPGKTYGDADFAVAATASSNLAVSFSASGNCTLSGNSVHIVSAGNCTITASRAADASFAAAAPVAQSFAIARAAAVIDVSGYSGVYDGHAHGATGTAGGVAEDDLTSLLTLGASFTNVPGGTAHWSFAGNTNYAPSSGDAAIAIAPADATISHSGYTGVYDGAAHGATVTATGVGGVPLGGVTNTDTFTNVPGGTAHWTFAGNGNYNAAAGTAAITLTRAALTVTADDKSKLLGAALPVFTARYSSFKGTDGPASLSGPLTFSTPATAASPAGTYAIAPSGLSSGNYTITFVSGALNVTYNVCIAYDANKAHNSGSTIPIKVQLCSAAGVTEGATNLEVHATELRRVSNQAAGAVEDSGQANPDDNFRLVGPGASYMLNLKTSGLTAGTYNLIFTVTGDPQSHAVTFQIR